MKKLLLIALLVVQAVCMAQTGLKGRITDTLNQPVSGAGIYLPELNKRTLSDAGGDYTFDNLPSGTFLLQVSHLGYKVVMEYVVLGGGVAEKNIQLTTSTTEYPEVVIYGFQSTAPERTANEIVPLTSDAMRMDGATSLSDGMARLPGVSQLTTGGISKPVIRGLYGNRIQTVLLGLRFDNQQWQDEHGLGLSDIGTDRIEIIKGPASLLYGSEAMGGVMQVIEEKPAPAGTDQFDFSMRFFSNTMGYTTDVGWKGANQKINWRLRAGTESHADYFDGNGRRILNSRYGGYYAKASIGFKKGNWISNNDYLFSMSNFGFLMDSINLFDPPDNRNSRSFDRPHHTVFLNVFSSQNSFYFEKSKLKINAGVQSNNRLEQEGGNKISLDMLLNTYIVNALWIKNLNAKNEFSLGTQDFFQTNKNLGSRTIIPDAHQLESSVFSYYKYSGKWLIAESGVRFDLRQITTYQTGLINIADPLNPGNTIVPFNKVYTAVNGSAGISLFDSKHWNFKANASTGYRPGNLAELSSNGLHEGTIRYEIGDINLKVEQNICADVLLNYETKHFTLNASAYYNRFFNYIYLQPTALQYIGFQIFQYVQKDATLQGAEFTAVIHPQKAAWMNWTTSFSTIRGTTTAGENLPFIPAPRLNSDFKITFPAGKKITGLFVKPGMMYVLPQDRPDQFETATDSYYLVNASAGFILKNAKNQILISVSGNNLLNNAYYDHLSRFKYFGVYNIGRNIALNFKMTFN